MKKNLILLSRSMTIVAACVMSLAITACGGGSDPSALETAQMIAAQIDSQAAITTSLTGAQAYRELDGCYLNNGYTKQKAIAEFDADAQQANQDRKSIRGTTRSNVKVIADRSSVNTDGTTRRELDISFQINYPDGTIARNVNQTWIYGSSSGSLLPTGVCTTPDNQKTWRFYGNRDIVSHTVTARNTRLQNYSISTGNPINSPPVTYGKYIRINISNPGNYVNYAIVSGPGIPTPSHSIKLISSQLLRDNPQFTNRFGRFLELDDSRNFRMCKNSADEVATDAQTADCVQFGGSTASIGYTNKLAREVDTNFDALGFVAGGIYTFDLYNDDGWNTVNGQNGKTPVATYTAKLNSLPYSAVTMAGDQPANDLFPKFTGTSIPTTDIASSLLSLNSFSFDVDWSTLAATPDAVLFGLSDIYIGTEGYPSGVANGGWPRNLKDTTIYPDINATSATLTIPTASTQMARRTYGQYMLEFSNRRGHIIQSEIQYY